MDIFSCIHLALKLHIHIVTMWRSNHSWIAWFRQLSNGSCFLLAKYLQVATTTTTRHTHNAFYQNWQTIRIWLNNDLSNYHIDLSLSPSRSLSVSVHQFSFGLHQCNFLNYSHNLRWRTHTHTYANSALQKKKLN